MKHADCQQVLEIISCPEFSCLNNYKYRQYFRHKKLVTINLHHLPPYIIFFYIIHTQILPFNPQLQSF